MNILFTLALLAVSSSFATEETPIRKIRTCRSALSRMELNREAVAKRAVEPEEIFIEYCRRGCMEEIEKALATSPEIAVCRNNHPLETAAFRGKLDLVKLLLQYPGVNPLHKRYSSCPLERAIEDANDEVVYALLTSPLIDTLDKGLMQSAMGWRGDHAMRITEIMYADPRFPSMRDDTSLRGILTPALTFIDSCKRGVVTIEGIKSSLIRADGTIDNLSFFVLIMRCMAAHGQEVIFLEMLNLYEKTVSRKAFYLELDFDLSYLALFNHHHIIPSVCAYLPMPKLTDQNLDAVYFKFDSMEQYYSKARSYSLTKVARIYKSVVLYASVLLQSAGSIDMIPEILEHRLTLW